MTENQNTEWKERWRDDYLRWICGFANAEGGVLVIGKNDDGEVVGLANAGKLLEDIPNKVRDLLGIMVDVNLRQEDGKIGFFRTDSDLLYHDEIHGDLFGQVEQALDLLLTKYLKAGISYEGLQRIESFPVPEAALREAVINAVAHKDYAAATPIQISVYHDKLMIWNPRAPARRLDAGALDGQTRFPAFQSGYRQRVLPRRLSRILGTGHRAHHQYLPGIWVPGSFAALG